MAQLIVGRVHPATIVRDFKYSKTGLPGRVLTNPRRQKIGLRACFRKLLKIRRGIETTRRAQRQGKFVCTTRHARWTWIRTGIGFNPFCQQAGSRSCEDASQRESRGGEDGRGTLRNVWFCLSVGLFVLDFVSNFCWFLVSVFWLFVFVGGHFSFGL